MKKILITCLFLIFTQLTMAQQTDENLRKVFREHIEMENAGSSVVMVEVSEKGTRFVNYGKLNKDANAANVDENTIYEIGSITKVFTGILLAEAVKRGEVKLDDPISKHLPTNVKTPTFNGKEITLLDLTTHRSSLPRLPEKFESKNPLDPYADYTVQNAYDFLSNYKLPREIGSQYEYSNFAVGLLGHILSLRAKMSYEELLTTRIFKPLQMTDTHIVLPEAKKSRQAQGLNDDNNPTPNWTFDVLAGAGAIRTTSKDMAKFISANLGLTESPLSASFTEARKMLRSGENDQVKIGLGWIGVDLDGTKAVVHGGGTYGFSSYILIAPDVKKGVFLVRNSGDPMGSVLLETVAFNAINNKIPIAKPKPPKKEIEVSEEVLDKYIGEYQLAPDFSIFITREGKQLFAQATGQGKFELYAEKEDSFFAKIAKISIAFKKDANGKVTEMILTQSGQDVPGKKVK